MSDILTKVIYDCHCNSYCNEKSYFLTKVDNVGNTSIYHGMHLGKFQSEEEILIGVFNTNDVNALIDILTQKSPET